MEREKYINSKNIKHFLFGNIYMVLFWRLALLFVLYAMMRAIYYLLNYDMFGKIAFNELITMFKGGYRFDKSAIFYLNIPIILLHIVPFRLRYNNVYQKVIKYLYLVINSVGIIVNIADAAYYRFTLRRTTMSVFHEFGNENKLKFIHFIWDYWYITLIVIALIILMIWAYGKIRVHKPSKRLSPFIYYPLSLLLMAFVLYESVGAMRGGWTPGTRPITLSNASAYISKPLYRPIVLNTPFALIRTIGKTVLTPKEYFSRSEAESLFPSKQTTNTEAPHFARFANRNVVIIIWESFAREWVGALNTHIPDYKGYTPFIDSLIPKSYVFKNAFANGRKSIDAIPSIVASIPAVETNFVLSNYSGNTINSLASILKEEGYYSAFFHGAPNGSMGFDAFVKQAGFDAYYGMDEYGNKTDFDGHWGIWDEEMLQFMAKTINKLPQPFLATAFTLSSHDPYVIPARYDGVFPKGHIPIHRCIGYSDHALKLFFETASKQAWFNNTLFVITADHAVNGHLDEYKNTAGGYAIPMILYAPNDNFVAMDDSTVVQQTDIMPTLLALLGKQKTFISFGNNMLDPSAHHFAINYTNGTFQFFENNYLLQFTDEKVVGLFNFHSDFSLNKNLTDPQHREEQQKMENRLKAFLQQYNDRLLNDKLHVRQE